MRSESRGKSAHRRSSTVKLPGRFGGRGTGDHPIWGRLTVLMDEDQFAARRPQEAWKSLVTWPTR